VTQSISCLHRRFHRWSGISLSLILIAIASLFLGVRLTAQVQSGISGTVLDSSGRAISGANVSATNAATGAISRSVTSSAGTFIVVGLEPGLYSISVDSVGFKTVQTTMTVEVAKVSSLDLTMVPGAATETVSVSTAPALQVLAPRSNRSCWRVRQSRSAVWQDRLTLSWT
jgi:Carboxypeptidase regulatory-like domain